MDQKKMLWSSNMKHKLVLANIMRIEEVLFNRVKKKERKFSTF